MALAPVPAQRRRLLTTQALPPPELEARVDTFLAGFRATLAAMPEAELGAYREALAVQVSDVDKRLAQQVRRRPIGTSWHLLASLDTSRHLSAPFGTSRHLSAPLGTSRHLLARWPETVPR